ncbi:tRNA (cytidine(34)-2'-O)-methyltransferase [Sphingomonas solaris]|uniref:tRNA (cytidine(34)-2'-O)-methyltransferase n=1 Tax=Alterirhizorhabdus solaris TaxID=2529389 RepID=A0A558R6N4_9SPHN|nr:tRNA (cytidine(34)-2'-O)-methyltransferase [Sphingomonas solaris]TVV75044.1 tRNA (cytidine(34)-2'-O)-methyltransferase [Sphingomonas solaris]
MRIALYQPDIAGNVGTIMRTAACFSVGLDVIEPCGFPFAPDRPERGLRRAAMDYGARADVRRHADWAAFRGATPGRLVLFTTRAAIRLPDARFTADDVLLFGSEGAGVPDAVHEASAVRVRIPLAPGARSLNVAVSAGIALAEALRQTGLYPA